MTSYLKPFSTEFKPFFMADKGIVFVSILCTNEQVDTGKGQYKRMIIRVAMGTAAARSRSPT